jgi:hypothetical protein
LNRSSIEVLDGKKENMMYSIAFEKERDALAEVEESFEDGC